MKIDTEKLRKQINKYYDQKIKELPKNEETRRKHFEASRNIELNQIADIEFIAKQKYSSK